VRQARAPLRTAASGIARARDEALVAAAASRAVAAALDAVADAAVGAAVAACVEHMRLSAARLDAHVASHVFAPPLRPSSGRPSSANELPAPQRQSKERAAAPGAENQVPSRPDRAFA
jgi:hypothetical protein